MAHGTAVYAGGLRGFGVFANIALAMNLVLLMAFMSLLGATLTLPGIAGIVLTVGMAVDANVLIFSRIREELAAGGVDSGGSSVRVMIAPLCLFLMPISPR